MERRFTNILTKPMSGVEHDSAIALQQTRTYGCGFPTNTLAVALNIPTGKLPSMLARKIHSTAWQDN